MADKPRRHAWNSETAKAAVAKRKYPPKKTPLDRLFELGDKIRRERGLSRDPGSKDTRD